jgi:hypothetical protein
MASMANGLPGPGGARVRPLVAWGVTAAAVFALLAICTAQRASSYRAATTISLAPGGLPATSIPAREQLAAAIREAFLQPAVTSPSDIAPDGLRDSAIGQDALQVTESAWSTPTAPAFHVQSGGSDRDALLAWLNRGAADFVARRNDEAKARLADDLDAQRAKSRSAWHEREALAREVQALETQTAAEPAPAPAAGAKPPTLQPPQASETLDDKPHASLIANPAWAAANAEVRRLEAEIATLGQRWTEEHPEMKHAALLLADAKKKLDETPALINSDSNGVAAAPTKGAPAVAPPKPEIKLNTPDAAATAEQEATTNAALAAELHAKREALSAANRTLDAALAREAEIVRAQTALAADLPWRVEPALSATAVPSGATHAPWFMLLPLAVALGGVAAWLAHGLRPMIDSPEEATALLGVPVVGVIPGDGSGEAYAEDPGYVAARWMTRAAVAVGVLVVALTVVAFARDASAATRLPDDPLSVFAMPREMLDTIGSARS